MISKLRHFVEELRYSLAGYPRMDSDADLTNDVNSEDVFNPIIVKDKSLITLLNEFSEDSKAKMQVYTRLYELRMGGWHHTKYKKVMKQIKTLDDFYRYLQKTYKLTKAQLIISIVNSKYNFKVKLIANAFDRG